MDTLGSGGRIGTWVKQLIVNGNPALAFYNETHTRLEYVRALDPQGISWEYRDS
ncbi:MAG: hypothetical protein R2850_08305 [Bacteroidia bacterium]